MEGVTDYTYRRVHSRHFPGLSEYYSPFIAANETRSMKTREKEDVAPEHNSGVVLVPQVLTNRPEVFLWALRELSARGYGKVNLNLGCPSATVVTHGKGAGFLRDTARLGAFFEKVFEDTAALDAEISVKTRIGVEDPEEAGRLLALFRRFPIAELIVHPRLRTDFYKGEVRLSAYRLFYEGYGGKLVYNGDIRCGADLMALGALFPGTDAVMIGRGLVANPALVRELLGGPPLTKEELRRFHDELLAERLEALRDFGHAAGKMKELWFYMGELFPDAGRELKKVKKARSLEEYRAAAGELFSKGELVTEAVPRAFPRQSA